MHKLMFDFWGLNGGIGLEIKGFDDTGYDNVFGRMKFGILPDFVEDFEIG